MVTSDNSSSDSDHRSSGKKRRRQQHEGDRKRATHHENRESRHHRRSSRDREDRRGGHREVENRRRDDRNRPNERPYKRSRNDFEGRNNRGGDRTRNSGKRSSFLQDTTGRREPEPEWGQRAKSEDKDQKPIEKEKPNFGLSGKLTEDTNMVHGVVIKYAEPADARKPKRRWRLYPFKGEKVLPTLYIHRQSAYLMGRDRKVADIPLDHPSCSKQHAALQYRLVPFKKENGSNGMRVRPYLIDLESANGTYVNSVKIEPRKFHELLERDVVKFGFSSREYVLLHEHSKDEDLDDDVETSNPA